MTRTVRSILGRLGKAPELEKAGLHREPRQDFALASSHRTGCQRARERAEYQRKVAEFAKKGQSFKEPQRYKGLGEMDAHQLADTTMSPRHRTLRRLTVDDGVEADRVFEMLMGNDVAPRKQFIVQGAYSLESDRIDA